MTEFDNLVLMVLSGYLVLGYLVYRWVQWMIAKKWRGDYTDDEREQIDQAVSLISVMLLWPKIVVPSLAWFLWRIFLGIIIIPLGYIIRLFRRK